MSTPAPVVVETNAGPAVPGKPAVLLAGKAVTDTLAARDLFAAHALQGLLAAHSGGVNLPDAKRMARWAAEYADALLNELRQPTA